MNVNDLVMVDRNGGQEAAVVTSVTTALGETVVGVYMVVPGLTYVGPENVHPVDVPRPAPGQRWRCKSRPDLVLTVESVRDGGLIADVRTPSGSRTDVVLIGHYEPVEVPR